MRYRFWTRMEVGFKIKEWVYGFNKRQEATLVFCYTQCYTFLMATPYSTNPRKYYVGARLTLEEKERLAGALKKEGKRISQFIRETVDNYLE